MIDTSSSRLYVLANSYLSGLQKGLQTAHLVGDMSVEFAMNATFDAWVKEHKTIIILEGGNHDMIKKHKSLFDTVSIELPSGIFYEDEGSLNNAATVTGIIMPDQVREYHLDKVSKGSVPLDYDSWEPMTKVVQTLSRMRLAV